MKLGIMQPYFLPYIGYWQLINAVDKYVVYDDVNFIKGGWINRNRILLNGEVKYINIPMLGASSNKLINEIGVNHDSQIMKKTLKMFASAYEKAPYYKQGYELFNEILNCEEEILSEYILNSMKVICRYLDIDTELILSSDINKDCTLKAQDKVLHICQLLHATEYYNAVGGQTLYSFEKFRERDIALNFLKTDEICYNQFGGMTQSNLSIIDVIMFNSKDEISEMLNKYSLIVE